MRLWLLVLAALAVADVLLAPAVRSLAWREPQAQRQGSGLTTSGPRLAGSTSG